MSRKGSCSVSKKIKTQANGGVADGSVFINYHKNLLSCYRMWGNSYGGLCFGIRFGTKNAR